MQYLIVGLKLDLPKMVTCDWQCVHLKHKIGAQFTKCSPAMHIQLATEPQYFLAQFERR